MKESIHIKNFGPLKDVHIEDIKPFVVIIGESGSGKSLLMKVIALFRWIYKKYNIRSYLKHSNILQSPFRLRMETLLKDNELSKFITDKTEIAYEVSFGKNSERKYRMVFQKSKLSLPKEIIEKEDICFGKINFSTETRNLIPLWADRGLVAASKKVSLGFYFTEIFSDFDKATRIINEINLPFLGIKFKVEKTPIGRKYFILPVQGDAAAYKIEFKNAASGMQNAVPLLLIAEYFSTKFDFQDAFKRTILELLLDSDILSKFTPTPDLYNIKNNIKKKIYMHIEEPELSLFPDAQCELLNEILRRREESKNEIELFITTHSPYIINHLNLLIAAHDANNTTETNGASLDYAKIAIYQLLNGELRNLKAINNHLVNTNPLSETIKDTYNAYNKLKPQTKEQEQ